MNTELIDKIRDAILSGEYSLCDNRWWCPLEDGYCPRYSCGQLEKIAKFTDRQWDNAIKYAKNMYGDKIEISLKELIDVLLCEYLIDKRPSNVRRKK